MLCSHRLIDYFYNNKKNKIYYSELLCEKTMQEKLSFNGKANLQWRALHKRLKSYGYHNKNNPYLKKNQTFKIIPVKNNMFISKNSA